jgi:hypothetical protein
MNMTFDQLVEELQGRPSEELGEIAELAHHYAIEQRRAEILKNSIQAEEDWKNGELKAYDNVDELMRSIDES